MAIPTSDISFNTINTELGYSPTGQLSISDANFRSMAGIDAGSAIDINTSKGKSTRWVIGFDPGPDTLNNGTSCRIWGISGPTATNKVGGYDYIKYACFSTTLIDGKFPVLINKIGRSGNLIETTLLGYSWQGGSINETVVLRGGYFDSSGNFYLGVWQSTAACWDIIKVNINGDLVWTTRLPSNTSLHVNTITTDSSGNVYISLQNWMASTPGLGRIMKLNSSGVFQWGTGQSDITNVNQGSGFMPQDMMVSVDNNSVYAAGNENTYQNSNGGYMALFKIDSSGNTTWVRQGGNAKYLGSCRDENENIYYAWRGLGYGSTTSKFYITVFNSSGVWQRETSYQASGYINASYGVRLHYDGTHIYAIYGISTSGTINQNGYGAQGSTARPGIAISKLTLSGSIVYSNLLYSDISGLGIFDIGETSTNVNGLSNILITGYLYNANVGYTGLAQQVMFSLPKDGSGTGYAINTIATGNGTHAISYAQNLFAPTTVTVDPNPPGSSGSSVMGWANAQFVYTVRASNEFNSSSGNSSPIAGSSLSSQPSYSYRKSNL